MPLASLPAADGKWDSDIAISALDSGPGEAPQLRRRLRRPHGLLDVSALALSPGGRMLASAGYDHAIRLWSVDELLDDARPG